METEKPNVTSILRRHLAHLKGKLVKATQKMFLKSNKLNQLRFTNEIKSYIDKCQYMLTVLNYITILSIWTTYHLLGYKNSDHYMFVNSISL